MRSSPLHFSTITSATRHILDVFPKKLSIAAPLGLGKPIELLNQVYDSIKNDSSRSLEIYTALSLLPPVPASDIERRFLGPFLERQFGENTPRLAYAEAMRKGGLPPNIKVHEFYFQAGQYVHRTEAQASYLSVNYTHVARAIFERGIHAVLQIVSRNPKNPKQYSLSCNPDVTLDMADLHAKAGRPLAVFAVVHPSLPFTGGDAIVDESFFAGIIDDPSISPELFALPRTPINGTDHFIGLYASQLIKDDGTLQIGIGSLSDALVHSTILRHRDNIKYVNCTESLNASRCKPKRVDLQTTAFSVGLYGTSEMIMDGFMHLRKAGILKRTIFDQDENKIRYLHGAFFLGSKVFYQWLRDLDESDREGFSMTRVSKVNDLYDEHEMALRRQRKNARFFNTCMKVSLLGGAVSDTIDSGEVVTGVGGQYNFVSMSHELPDSHSILMLRSTRTSGRKRRSNIVFNQPHETIPRHLRDVVITEYGIAHLRGRTDEEVIQALIEISDSEFQMGLLQEAKAAGKISAAYAIPEFAKNNTPTRIEEFMNQFGSDFPSFPFGSDFTDIELKIAKGLAALHDASTFGKIKTFAKGLFTSKQKFSDELKRMDLWPAKGAKARLTQVIVVGALNQS